MDLTTEVRCSAPFRAAARIGACFTCEGFGHGLYTYIERFVHLKNTKIHPRTTCFRECKHSGHSSYTHRSNFAFAGNSPKGGSLVSAMSTFGIVSVFARGLVAEAEKGRDRPLSDPSGPFWRARLPPLSPLADTPPGSEQGSCSRPKDFCITQL